nr:PREDICTED: spermatogenesis-associated protein 45 [Anolis carolinensis]|eukprot:XP_016849486.1 PREDICTED: spermatogenesis-associated protein 45 [Anolis carolinensis]
MYMSVQLAMSAEEQKRLIAYNRMRESNCWLETKLESTWLRPQRRHFPQSNRSSMENYIVDKHEYISGRTSWIRITPPQNREKRHFPEKGKRIYTVLWINITAT